MTDTLVVLRQGDPLVVIGEKPIVIYREVPTSVVVNRYGTTIEENNYGSQAAAWGSITGNILDQTDLQSALQPTATIIDGGNF